MGPVNVYTSCWKKDLRRRIFVLLYNLNVLLNTPLFDNKRCFSAGTAKSSFTKNLVTFKKKTNKALVISIWNQSRYRLPAEFYYFTNKIKIGGVNGVANGWKLSDVSTAGDIAGRKWLQTRHLQAILWQPSLNKRNIKENKVIKVNPPYLTRLLALNFNVFTKYLERWEVLSLACLFSSKGCRLGAVL